MQFNQTQKRHGTRALLLLMALTVLLSTCLTACGGDGEKDKIVVEALQSDSEVTGIDSNWNYGDQTFTFYVGTDGWETNDIWDDDKSSVLGSKPGEPIYDAVIQRMSNMEEKYQCSIAITGRGDEDPYSAITSSLNSADNAFQAISTQGATCYTLATEGYLWDFSQWENLDTTKSWWDQNFVDQLTINGHLYFLVGEYSKLDNQMTHAVAFNKTMCEQYDGLPSADEFYTLVDDGKWTLDKMIEYSGIVTHEVNGDGKLDGNDCIGLCYRQTSIYGFLQGSGVNIAEKNAKGEIELSFYSDKATTLWQKLLDIANANYSICEDTDGTSGRAMMDADRCLFFTEYIDTFDKMRALELEFGILPFPKYDENQADYISASHDYGTNFLCVPLAITEYEDIANVLTVFSYEGQQLLTPAFYDNVLMGRTVKDEQSEAMLDLIFTTKYYDLGTYMNWANFSKDLMTAWKEKSYGISSLYSSSEKRIKKMIREAMEGEYFGSEI